jgi:ABC-type Fe3+/spermidine/putrescine transport system ATPase subunit
VFVTHDQEEALVLSDRIFVMNEGCVVEEGTPMDIYSRPTSAFAGLFIGHSNTLRGTVAANEGQHLVVRCGEDLTFRSAHTPNLSEFSQGEAVLALIRQERMRLHTDANGDADPSANSITAEISLVTFLGPIIEYICMVGNQEIRVRRPNEGSLPAVSPGEQVQIEWDPADCVVVKA